MQLTFDSDVEAFRADFVAFLDENLPPEAEALDDRGPAVTSRNGPAAGKRLMFDNGWLIPGNPPEFGGRNATILQQYATSWNCRDGGFTRATTPRASASSPRR